MTARVPNGAVQWPWVVVFIAAALALMAAGYAYYRSEADRIREEKYADLSQIAELKAGQIREWRNDQLLNVGAFANGPLFRTAMEAWLQDRNNEALFADLKEELMVEQRTDGYANTMLCTPEGQVLLSIQPDHDTLDPVASAALTEALAKRSPVLSELSRDKTGHVVMYAVSPILNTKGQPIAAAVFVKDADSLLYPLIQSWPTSCKTAETLLVRKDGDGLLFLNNVRYRPDAALSLREPLTLTTLPAVQAVLGKRGMVEGKDYRGHEVLADLRAIPDSPWFMVAKVDTSELLEEARYRGGMIVLFCILFIGLAAAATAYGYRHRQAGLYEQLYFSEREQRETQKQFRTILYSIGDAVITTDKASLVKQMNPVAETLTGWTEAEAVGRPLQEVFVIVAEESRSTVDHPVEKVLREGMVVGLANHTLLIARDGTERPIADSGAPVRDENGTITGVVLVFRDRTEERTLQKELEQSEERYRTVADHTYDWEFWIAPDGKLVYCSPSCERVTGYSAEEYLADPGLLDRIVHPDDREIWAEHSAHVAEASDRCEFDYRIVTRKGEIVWIAHCCSPVHSQDGLCIGRRSSNRDITDRKRAEDALAESEHKFRYLYEDAPIAYQSLDEEGYLLQVNQAWLHLLGYGHDGVVGRHFCDFLTPKSRQIFQQVFPKFKQAGQVSGIEHEMVRKDGSIINVSVDGRVSRADDSGFMHTHCVFQDITQRKQAEKGLLDSEQRYRATFNIASVGIDLVDAKGRFLEVNCTLSQFLGYAPEEFRQLTILDITHPEDVTKSWELHAAMVRGDTDGYRLEKRYVRKDGTVVWADTAVSAIRDADGTYKATVGVIRDITQHKKSEEVRVRLAAAVEQAAETVMITDASGAILYVNPAFVRTTGYTREEVVGKNPRFLRSGRHDNAFYQQMWDSVTNGRIWTGHLINRKKDGTVFEEDASISPVKDKSGEIVYFVAVKRDVTKEASLQTQLFQAQKMEAIGTLAGGVAHDFNNILQVALGYSDLILLDEELPRQFRSDVRKIHESAKRGADLVQRLLTFSRKTEIKPRPLNLNRRLVEIRKMLERTLPKMIDIQLSLGKNIAKINADPTQIDQVLMNLGVNARDAMPHGGKLLFETADIVIEDEYANTHLDARKGPHVLLKVTDTGSGMSKETLEHIFEPFYTTKPPGEGTGLGLAMVHGIVKQHGGHITCYTAPGRGTTFHIYFPALTSHEEPEERTLEEVSRGGTETILLVDDEDDIRDLGSKMLTKAGYTVIPASNGKEALEKFQAHRDKIALVILDLVMPELGGDQCLLSILDHDPTARVLIASGYSVHGLTREALVSGARGFVSKPFRLDELLTHVRRALDEA